MLVAVALDGRVARRTLDGYEVRTLTSDELADVRNLLSHQREWAIEYLLSGSPPEPRWRLTLGGSTPRAIVLDNPLANPDVPESLYRLILAVERPRFGPGSWRALGPGVVRVWLTAAPSGGEAAAAPAWLDATAASSATGQRLTLAVLSESGRAWLLDGGPTPGESGRLVRLADGQLGRLSWSVDWAIWAQDPR